MVAHKERQIDPVEKGKEIIKKPDSQGMQQSNRWNYQKFRKERIRILASGRVLGDPGNWNVVKDGRELINQNQFKESETDNDGSPSRVVQVLDKSKDADTVVADKVNIEEVINQFHRYEECNPMTIDNAMMNEKTSIVKPNVIMPSEKTEVSKNNKDKLNNVPTEAIGETTKEWVNKSFVTEKTVEEEEPNHATIQDEIEDNILPIAEEDTVKIKSHMKDLYDIVSHYMIETEVILKKGEKAASTCDVEESEAVAAVLDKVGVAAGLSPKSHSKASKKKHGNSKGQPLRAIPYRVAKDVDIMWDDSQQISYKLTFQRMNKIMFVTMVYTKCDAMEGLVLWNSLYILAGGMVAPWLIGGFKGSPFTWWNGRSDGQSMVGFSKVDHLSRTGSDHAPLLLSDNEQQQQFIRPFKFLKFWKRKGIYSYLFKKKVKKIKVVLSAWSRQVFGDIFKQLTIKEDIVRIKEQLFEESPTEVNRMVLQRAQAELKRYLHYEEECWRQKSGYDCFAEGDRNTKFFHNIVNGRRKRTLIRRIQNGDGNWIESANERADEAISFYQKQFTQDSMQNFQSEMAILDHIPSMLSQEENADIVAIPTMKEVKQAVIELSGDSASDVFHVVKVFFEGQTLPKSITHTNLVLLPKKNEVESFSDMRPISLSNFINKVISRVVHHKLEKALPRLIYANQSSFVWGRNIIENVLLTQEIVSDIRLRVLTRALNALFDDQAFKGYGMPKWSANLNHLAYADDTIVFASADAKSLELIMDTLKAYEDKMSID
ncbi:uncharacterized protein LOC132034569 [Lycium ferocissimum]|uniref:uncharacterized protein LOC132034569 n=1 Tax=Lycium ferocissimum TaxID=112874 RepID=UPI0028164771|nr:uncharacterized protein LOC132034569 [Lycium ferocissimum]